MFLVLNMAFADLMLGAFTLPFYIFVVGGDYQLWTVKYDSEHMAYQIFYTSFDNIFCLARIYLQPLFLVRDFMPYFGRLNTFHYPPEHTASSFS